MLQALFCISGITKSHLTNALEVLNFLRRIASKQTTKNFDQTERKKRSSVGEIKIFIYLAEQ